MDDILSCIQTLNGLGEKGTAAIELIKKYTTNILDNPAVAKYRRIRIENVRFNEIIWNLEAARNLVYALGFEQEGSDYLVLPEDVDLSLIKELLVKPSAASSTSSQPEVAAPSLRLGRPADDRSYFDSMQVDMTLLSYLVEMGYDREIGQRALVATGNKGVQPAMDWISANPLKCVVHDSTPNMTSTEEVPVKSKPVLQPPTSRYEVTAAERHAFQEKKRKEEISAARIAKKDDIAAKKILLASVEAEKKLRQAEVPSTDQPLKEEEPKMDHPGSTKKQCHVAMIKLRMPNGKASTLQLQPSDTIEVLYQHVSQEVKTSASDIKLLCPSTSKVFADQTITLEDAGLTPRGLVIVRLPLQDDEDPR